MLSTVSKALLPLAAVAGFAAYVYGWFTGGDHFGVTMLVSVAIGAVIASVLASDRPVADTDLETAIADGPPSVHSPVEADPMQTTRPSEFPIIIAFGLGAFAFGAATESLAAYLAGAVIVVGGLGWLAQSWREHPLWTPRFADRFGAREVGPVSFPIVAIVLGAITAIGISRLYLTVSETAAVVVSASAATVLFVGCLILSLGGNLVSRLTGTLAGAALIALIGVGVAGAAGGERFIPSHGHGDFTEVRVEAEGLAFDRADIKLPEGRVRVHFENNDPAGTYHDIGVYSATAGGDPFFAIVPTNGGTEAKGDVDTTVVGMEIGKQYFFRCDFHPAMVGTLNVVPAPAETHGEEDHG